MAGIVVAALTWRLRSLPDGTPVYGNGYGAYDGDTEPARAPSCRKRTSTWDMGLFRSGYEGGPVRHYGNRGRAIEATPTTAGQTTATKATVTAAAPTVAGNGRRTVGRPLRARSAARADPAVPMLRTPLREVRRHRRRRRLVAADAAIAVEAVQAVAK